MHVMCDLGIVQRNPAPRLIVHSDRGTQYASGLHQALLAQHGLVGNMSRKGNCWDNAVMERFFLNLKMERVWQKDYANRGCPEFCVNGAVGFKVLASSLQTG
jgi:putative transposase